MNRFSSPGSASLAALLFAAALGCSSSDSGLPVPDGGSGGGGAGGGANGGSGGDGGNGGDGGSAGTDGPMSTDGRDGLGAPEVGFTDAPPPSPGKIDCGPMSCDVKTQECCEGFDAGGVTYSCIARGAMCAGAKKTCDGKEDCDPGELCCLKKGYYAPTVSCQPESMCRGGMGDGYPLCHTDSDCPKDRPNCCAISSYMTTFTVCSAYRC